MSNGNQRRRKAAKKHYAGLKNLNARLPEKLKERFDKLCEEHKVERQTVIRELVEKWVAEKEA